MKTIMALFLLIFNFNVFAYDQVRALNNFSHEAAECGAYFIFLSAAPGLDEKTVKGLQNMYMSMLEVAIGTSTRELSRSRLEISINTMRRETHDEWANLSIVNNIYGYRCKDFHNDIEGRMEYWLDKNE